MREYNQKKRRYNGGPAKGRGPVPRKIYLAREDLEAVCGAGVENLSLYVRTKIRQDFRPYVAPASLTDPLKPLVGLRLRLIKKSGFAYIGLCVDSDSEFYYIDTKDFGKRHPVLRSSVADVEVLDATPKR